MVKDFSEKITVVILDKILFEITGWYDSALNDTWSLSKYLSDSDICMSLLNHLAQIY